MAIIAGSTALASDILNLVKLIRKTADETVNNSAVLQDDNELFLPMLANEVWQITLSLIVNSSAVADLKLGFTAPAGAAMYSYSRYIREDNVVCDGFASLAATLLLRGVGANEMPIFLTGIVINGANAGNFQIQWAQATAEVSDTKVLTNSYIIAHKMA